MASSPPLEYSLLGTSTLVKVFETDDAFLVVKIPALEQALQRVLIPSLKAIFRRHVGEYSDPLPNQQIRAVSQERARAKI